jgi:hypothetical protein
LILSIIKTNKNNTAIAPTSIPKKEIGRTSKLNKTNKHETFVNEKMRKRIEKIGFFVKITKSDDKIQKLEKK